MQDKPMQVKMSIRNGIELGMCIGIGLFLCSILPFVILFLASTFLGLALPR